ncbi:MAG: hypothetical protein LIO95_10100 [Clostridiales bacterium]|nr:hypothetical protein [Clostridiales bacterium]
MNEFIIHPVKLTPEQAVRGTLGVPLREFIEAVVKNEGGKYDALYKQKEETS